MSFDVKSVLYFDNGIFIDVDNGFIFSEPSYNPSEVTDINDIIFKYNLTKEDIKNAIDYSITEFVDIKNVNVTGPKLSTNDTTWKDFISEVCGKDERWVVRDGNKGLWIALIDREILDMSSVSVKDVPIRVIETIKELLGREDKNFKPDRNLMIIDFISDKVNQIIGEVQNGNAE